MELIFNFLNNNFEIIMGVNLVFLMLFGLALLLVRLRDIKLSDIQKASRYALFYTIVAAEFLLFMMTVYIVVKNYKPVPLDYTFKVQGSTAWVKDKLKIYFIAGNTLKSIYANGDQEKIVFEDNDAVREYQFSPDGKYILIVTESKLVLLNRKDKTRQLMDALNLPIKQGQGIGGVISGIQWGPSSKRFCYRVAKWSQYSSLNNWYVYDIETKDRRKIQSPALDIVSLVWDQRGEDLYFSWFESLDTSVFSQMYDVKIYKIPLSTLRPQLILKRPFAEPELPPDILAANGIHLFIRNEPFSFGRSSQKYFSWDSIHGSRIGIDDQDILYYRRARFWRKRLFKVPRVGEFDATPGYPLGTGPLAISHLRWFPSGRYVIMTHHFFGVLILEPSSGRIGILTNERGNTFGWYT